MSQAAGLANKAGQRGVCGVTASPEGLSSGRQVSFATMAPGSPEVGKVQENAQSHSAAAAITRNAGGNYQHGRLGKGAWQ